MRFLTETEQLRLIEAAALEPKAPYLQPFVILGLNTGLRKSELLHLRVDDISLEHNRLRVEDGKGGSRRFIPLNETAKTALTQLLMGEKKGSLFHDRYGRQIEDVKKAYASALKKAGLLNVRIHDLRRTFGTDCARRGIEPRRLQEWMGHKSIETTMKYYVVANQDYELEAIRKLDGRMDPYKDTLKNEGLQETLQPFDFDGEPCKIRTCDPLIKSQLLYQLS